MLRCPEVLSYVDHVRTGTTAVGRVHRDGSITFGGKWYRTIADLPRECIALRPDADTVSQWRSLTRNLGTRAREGGRPDLEG